MFGNFNDEKIEMCHIRIFLFRSEKFSVGENGAIFGCIEETLSNSNSFF